MKLSVITALRDDLVLHVPRPVQAEKNLLATGQISSVEAITIIQATRGNQVEVEPYEQDPSVDCYILKPVVQGVRWYVKCFERSGIWFVSFHRQETGS